MAEIETPAILDEVRSIVSDRLQVVSYKWLSRNFLVSSNAAKRLLQEFVEKYGNELEVIYSLSGWLKSNPSTYHIRLVSTDRLSDEAKQEFVGNCSIQVYSVQACLPKYPAILWNHEFVQAEILFKQPLAVDNCLRDNSIGLCKFCGVSSSFIKRSAGGGTSLGTGTLQAKFTGGSVESTSYSARKTTVFPEPPQHTDSTKTVKNEIRVKLDTEQRGQLADKGKGPKLLDNTKNCQTDKNSLGAGGALASMWSRASAKPKPEASLAQPNNCKQDSAASAEPQICARDPVEYGSSGEDGQDFNIKRTSNGESRRKRKVIFDYSDDEDEHQDAVNLASPDSPKRSTPCLKDSSSAFGLECKLSFEEKEKTPKIKEEVKVDDVKANKNLGEEVPCLKIESPTSDKTLNIVPQTNGSGKDKMENVVPKRKKVLRTQIDHRGREGLHLLVTEVVWEGEEPDTKFDNNSAEVVVDNVANNAVNRQPVAKKSPAVSTCPSNQAGNAGNKKAGIKDPKQGNIMSFFKKV
ncbi:hypothetical protein OROGR_015415 [Orobanche gracilis]